MSQTNSNDKPEIFVLVPSYNHARFIERCLQSIIKQTVQPTKLLVIDDGSRDDSVKVIEKTLADCPFSAELVARENRGLCRTLNEGYGKSFGKYFAYLGSDDVWLSEFLETRVETLESRSEAILSFGHAFLIDEDDRIIDCTKNWTTYEDRNILPMLLRGIVPASSSIVYRRTALENQYWNEDSILEDYELYLKLSCDGEFAFDSRILSAWRQHGHNTSGNFSKMLDEWLAAQNRVAGKLKLDPKQLTKLQTALKFNSALDFIRQGQKKRAAQIMRENLSGATSLSAFVKVAWRLLLPTAVINWRRRLVHEQNAAKHGSIKI